MNQQAALFDHLFSLRGKTAFVSGAATGIGRMIATGLVLAGASVLIASRKGADCEAVAAELNQLAGENRVEGFAGDVSTEAGILALAEAIGARTDRLDILVNNAGISWGAPYESFPHAAWEKVFAVNVAAVFTLTRALMPLMEKAASEASPARIINLGSVMGTIPQSENSWSYAASKAAVHHLTKMLAQEFAHRRITVNAFAPGPFQSRMTAFAVGSEEKAEAVGKNVPLGRIGSPDDIMAATLFLCGHGGSYISGQILGIDGGISVQTNASIFDAS